MKRFLSNRVLIVVAVALVASVAAFVALRPETGVPEGAPTEAEMARAVGADIMTNIYRGHVAERSGEIMLVPKPHNFLIGEWDLTSLGTNTPTMSTSHPNPWRYLAHVPIILSGEPWVSKGTEIEDEIDIAGLATTFAELLGVEEAQPEAPPLPGLDTAAGKPPRAIIAIVIDGGGWNALQQHVNSWPTIDRLRRTGTTYVNAHIGSAPSITGAVHSTFGTGVYPRTHGIPGNQMRAPNGTNVDTWLDDADPRFLKTPTVAELWDEQTDNEAVVATVSYEGWHLGMIGHGAARPRADKDVAVLWRADEDEWWINEDYYELPDYLEETDIALLERYESDLDERDGLADGRWFGHLPDELLDETARAGTPAFVRFTGDAVVDVLRRERVGRDEITDIVWVEMKMPDFAGHAWNVTGPEQADVLAETDRQIARFIEELESAAGRGRYLVAVSADHGQQPLPDLYGGWRINSKELERDIEDRFGPVVEKVTPVDVYLDADALEAEGVETSDIARYLGTYTLGDNVPDTAFGANRVPEARKAERLFAGAFSTGYIESLSVDRAAALGPGSFDEHGNLGRLEGDE